MNYKNEEVTVQPMLEYLDAYKKPECREKIKVLEKTRPEKIVDSKKQILSELPSLGEKMGALCEKTGMDTEKIIEYAFDLLQIEREVKIMKERQNEIVIHFMDFEIK